MSFFRSSQIYFCEIRSNCIPSGYFFNALSESNRAPKTPSKIPNQIGKTNTGDGKRNKSRVLFILSFIYLSLTG